MYELEKFGQYLKKPKVELHRGKFELVDGIKYGQTRTIKSKEGGELVTITLGKLKPGIVCGDADENTYFRVLVAYGKDGAVQEVLIDFTPPFLEWQAQAETDPWQKPL